MMRPKEMPGLLQAALYDSAGSPRLWRPGAWRRKVGPVLTWGRLSHLTVGAALAYAGWFYRGDEGLVVGVVAGALVGWGWERATWFLAPLADWPHPFGDLADALSFTLGGLLMGVVALVTG